MQVLDNDYHLVGFQVTIAQSHYVEVRGLVDLCAKIELTTKHKIEKVDIVFVKLDELNMREFKRQRFALPKQSPDKENETAWLEKKVICQFLHLISAKELEEIAKKVLSYSYDLGLERRQRIISISKVEIID